MIKRGTRMLLALVLAATSAVAWAQADADKLTTLVVKTLPVGELFQGFVDRDPKWPLGEKAARVEASQLQCLRQRLSAAGYLEQRRAEVAAFASRHPDKVAESLRVLEAGGAEMFSASITMGAEQARTGQKADYAQLASRFTPGQLAAFVELTNDDKHRALRELIGIGDAVSLGSTPDENGARGRSKGMAIGVKLMLAAMDHCKIPMSAVQ